MEKYNHKKIEAKWHKRWKKEKLYKTAEDKGKPKYYILDMFPYPSGAGLHVGHPKGFIATDIFARAKMMQGYNVLHPMGWDAFGLPTENYAIQNKIHPRVATEKNIATYKRQLDLLGFTYDWEREINTTDPEYYKWTQWTFIKMFERGLAYESYEPINWCPKCQTGLSNEDLEDGKCERCGSAVERRPMRQWVLKITDYADRMLNDLEKLPDWEESIKEMQRNWIGRSEGAEVEFRIIPLRQGYGGQENHELRIKVFTTRPDTLFGATFMVISPEHKLVQDLKREIKNWLEVEKYINAAKKKSDLERTDLNKEKTGVKLEGVMAINPVNNEEIPIFMADYVLTGYGTGAIMAVPAHDERDWEFAKKYGLSIREVVAPLIINGSGDDAFRQNMPVKERNSVVCVVKHWAEEKFMGIRWLKNDWQGFVIGGIETGETPSATGVREIAEETGYKNVEFVKPLGSVVHSKFFQLGKKENRFAHFVPLLFKLKNGEKKEIAEKEKALHNVVWLSKEEFDKFVNREDMKIIWGRLRESECYAGNGISINSDFLNDLPTIEAKEKMIEWLEEKKLGKRAINYKIKDWVFSRQRYWGEPIPMVHCEACKNEKYNFIFIHGYDSTCKTPWKLWLKSELEKRGHTFFGPELPNTTKPNVEVQANFILKNVKISKDTIIIGHSLGGTVMMKVLEKAKTKIARAVFLDAVLRPKFNDEERQDVAASSDWKFNFKKIKKAANEFVVLADKDFPIIPKDQSEELGKLFDAKVIYVKPNYRHFSRAETEPTVLKLFTDKGLVSVPYEELPLKLPEVKNYEPTGTGESPLANIKEWVNTKCPKCGGPAKRETNTMPQWAGSSWYYLRYIDPKNKKALVEKGKEKYWSPVDFYVGGAEHATRHLIYARFWHKFLYDIGAVNYDEPFTRLQHVGLILAEDGRKMSKRWNNVINPDDMVEKFGADAMRVYEMFMGPFSQPCAWSTNGVIGARRFLENVYKLKDKKLYDCKGGDCKIKESGLPKLLHKTIKKVSEDIENFHYNTAISQMMIFMNFAGKFESLPRPAVEKFLIILAPFAPHLAEELWAELGHKESIFKQSWPKYNPELVKDETINLVIQVNSRVRETIEVSADISEEEAKKVALESEKVKKWLAEKKIVKVIFVKGKLINIVVK